MCINSYSMHKLGIFGLYMIALFCCSSGYEENLIPAEFFSGTFICFSKEYIYRECEEEYRLDQTGNLNIPRPVTDEFCSGPCFQETKLVLNCIEDILSNFLFYNKARVRDIRYALRGGCSFTSQRGNFNVGDYIYGETSSANWVHYSGYLSFVTATYMIMYFVRV